MQKEDILKLQAAAENNCRLYFDQLTTLQQQATTMAGMLERERGKTEAYKELAELWPDPKPQVPEEDRHLPPAPKVNTRKTGSLIPVPGNTSKRVIKKEQ